jgi:hypothetical protein
MVTTPITGKAAFEKFLSIYGHGHIWLKTGHSDFWKGEITDGNCIIHKTKKSEKGDRELIGQSYDAYTKLRRISEYKGGGVFFIPGRPSDAPLKEFHTGSNLVSCEMDNGTTEEQLARIEWFSSTSGLDWALIIGSGGKSKHPHLKASEWLDVEQRLYLQKLLNMAMRSDPAVNNPHQPMRIPGFYRKEKEKEQTLDYYSYSAYSYEQLLEGISKVFVSLDWKIPGPEQLTRDGEGTTLWGEVQRVLKRKKLKDFDYSQLSDNDVISTIKELLDKPSDYFDKLHQSADPTPPEVIAEIKRSLGPIITNPGKGTVDLFDCLYPYYQDLIKSGVGAGGAGRDPEGFKLSCHVQQVEEILSRNGINYSGNGRSLLDEYCARCSPALSRRDSDKLWGRYSRYGNKYSLDEGILLKKVAKLLGVKTPELKAKTPHPVELFARRLQHKAEKLKRWWKQQRKFTPTITQNQKYSQFPIIEDGSIFQGKGGTGTGKTYQMEQLFKPPVVDKKADIYEEGGQFYHDGAVMIGSRNSLQLQNANRLGFKHLQRDKCFHILHDPKSKVALCSNSLPHFLDPKWFDNKVLVLDEIMELLQHLLHSRTHKNHAQCLKLWSECLRRAKTIILLDANLADWAVDEYIINLAGRRKVVKLENKFKGDRAPVEFLIGTPTKRSKLPENIEKGLKEKGLNSRDISPYISSIMAGKIPIIFTDSQKQAEAIDSVLTNVCGKKGLRIDSKTIAEKGSYADKFMSNPNNVIKTLLPQFVVCSPSVQSGVDINITDYFTDSYGLFFGVVGTNTQLQMMGRLRDPNVRWHIACPEYTRKNNESFGSSSTKNIVEALKDYLLQDTAIITKDLPQLFDLIKNMVENLKDDPHHNAWAKLKAIENYEKANLRDCLIEVLTEAGHEIKFVELQHDDDGAELLKEAKETVLRKESSEIFNAPDIDRDKIQELQASFDATWEDRCQILKASYLDRLPGIENSKFWNEELIYLFRKHQDFISQSELYYFLYHPHHLQEQQQELWAYIALGGLKFLPDIRSRHLKIKALSKLGIKEILESGKPYTNKSPEILEMLKTARRSKKMSAALGIVPGTDPIKYLRKILALVGHSLVCKKSNGDRSYQVVQDVPEIRDSLAKCLSRKYDPILSTTEQKSSKWEEVKSVFSMEKHNPLSGSPQSFTNTGLESRALDPNELIQKGGNAPEKTSTFPEQPDQDFRLTLGDEIDFSLDGRNYGMAEVIEIAGSTVKALWPGWSPDSRIIETSINLITKVWRMGADGLEAVWRATP